MKKNNIDLKTVDGFGDEWSRFDQSKLSDEELLKRFEEYFFIFPFEDLSNQSVGFDMGCGSGRWAKLMAPRVGILHCVDPSSALKVARKNLKNFPNCTFHNAGVDSLPMKDNSMDFGYSLGVLHHIPNPVQGLQKCVEKLKPGAPFLLYFYYAFDNRPVWFRSVWLISNFLRLFVAKLPYFARYWVSQIIAVVVYLPLTRVALIIEKLGYKVDNIPLSYYRKYSFYSMRTDALDRFGTRLEHRYTRAQIKEMMEASGLENISFSPTAPYWCSIGFKSANAIK
jgi:ubiquinone/menaquinone biosynthesis C-methylase UbiE